MHVYAAYGKVVDRVLDLTWQSAHNKVWYLIRVETWDMMRLKLPARVLRRIAQVKDCTYSAVIRSRS